MGLFRMVLAPVLLACRLGAQTVDGDWRAEVEASHGGIVEITIHLNENEGVLTGRVRDFHGETPISSGVRDGDNISFLVITDVEGYQITQRYSGILDEDVVHFSLRVEDQRSHAAQSSCDFEAKRRVND